MATARNAVDALYRHLRREIRSYPFDSTHPDNPLSDALVAVNGAIQQLCATCPAWASQQQRSALFRPPQTIAVTALSTYGTTAQSSSANVVMRGCKITLPGDEKPNRIVNVAGTVISVERAYLGSLSSGNAVVSYDACELGKDIISVMEPVRLADGTPLRAANSRQDLDAGEVRSDYGRLSRVPSTDDEALTYFIETCQLTTYNGLSGSSQYDFVGDRPRLRMMLSAAPTEAMNVSFEARCQPAKLTEANIHNGPDDYADPETFLPIPADFFESIFLPLAVARFYSTPIMRDVPRPQFVDESATAAMSILQQMRPQANRPARIIPFW